ncbi:MAG TPA: DUF2341 domain-containing protein [Methanothrix sp.]|nr:DUF2341 domain-containing protein [Methanothrix sp.]HPJ84447.1 DUF2341 domain-containing protein [Methanothrix sp.]HPR65785.1 DUF2341 domain-containing protein [Methanothrix sp.]
MMIAMVLLGEIAGTAFALSNSGDGDWAYYKVIEIRENSGRTLSDFQVRIELSSANFDFSKAKYDGSDIRISVDGKELNYWIEEWDFGANKAVIWVKVPNIPENEVTELRMYCGNPNATAVSNANSVFEFFDNFSEDTSSDYIVKNLSQRTGSICWDPSNERLILNTSWDEGGTAGWNAFYYNKKFGSDIITESTMKLLDGGLDVNNNGMMFGIMGRYNPSVYWTHAGRTGGLETRSTYSPSQISTIKTTVNRIIGYKTYSYSTDETYDFKLGCVGLTSNYYINDILISSACSSDNLDGGHVGWMVYAADVAVDDLKVRKFAYPEPTTTISSDYSDGVAGIEAEAPSSAKPDATYAPPTGYWDQPSYTGDCTECPEGSICIKYSDGFIWLVYDLANKPVIDERASSVNTKIEVAKGHHWHYYHVLETQYASVKTPITQAEELFASIITSKDQEENAEDSGWTLTSEVCPEGSENSMWPDWTQYNTER